MSLGTSTRERVAPGPLASKHGVLICMWNSWSGSWDVTKEQVTCKPRNCDRERGSELFPLLPTSFNYFIILMCMWIISPPKITHFLKTIKNTRFLDFLELLVTTMAFPISSFTLCQCLSVSWREMGPCGSFVWGWRRLPEHRLGHGHCPPQDPSSLQSRNSPEARETSTGTRLSPLWGKALKEDWWANDLRYSWS